jgi:hypothetical protein
MAKNKFNSSMNKLEFLTSIILKKLFDKNDCNPDPKMDFFKDVKISVYKKQQRIILTHFETSKSYRVEPPEDFIHIVSLINKFRIFKKEIIK